MKDMVEKGEEDSVAENVKMRIFQCDKMPESFPESPYTKWFDYDIIKDAVVMRTWETEDYITIDNKGNTQKLKKYFVNAKIPKEQRDKVLLAADGNHIMWIVGYRQNQAYQVSEKTTHILEIKIERGKEIE
jgi:tRNA(Ile)-lysidine synthase